MVGWLLFRHAVLMLVRNFRMALQISVLPILIYVLVFFLLDRFSEDPSVADRERIPFDRPVGGFPDLEPDGVLSFLVLLSLGVTIAWIGVAWHRYILLDERSGLPLPRVNPREIGLYLATSLKLLLLFTILAIPAILFMVLIPPLGLSGLLFPLLLSGLLFFLGTLLPSAALGEWQRTKDALEAVKDHISSILVLTALTVGFTSLLSLFINLLGDHFFIGAVSVAATWLSLFLHLCILTTLYGYFIEKRELS